MSFVVFAVENADRLTLLGPPVGGKPTFKQVALSFIHAPKQAKRLITGEFGPEDPCAYAATELVRAAFIGKPVKFSEDYYIEPLQRSAGRLTLATGGDAAAMLLEAGLALAPDQIPPRMEKSLFAQYGKLMAEAKTAQRGLFSPTASRQVRELTSLSGEQIAKRLDELHGKTFSARVERALSATALVVTCADAFGACAQFPVHMSGITVRELGSEELVAESKFHTERYLLHRNVNVRFDGSDAMGNVLVSVVAKKLFQEDLLHRGLAHIQNSTVGHTKSMEAFREAEAEAKSKRVGVWKTFTEEEERKQVVVANNGTKEGIVVANAEGPSGPQYQGPMHFTGILTQVVHGDTVVVRNDESGAYIRLTLAGVRSSKNIQRDQDGNSPETRVTYNDYSWEAKDFVRKHYIGEKVEVQVEFARLMPETKEIRPAATVGIPEKNVNIGAALLDAGFASFFLGKTDSCSEAVALQSAQDRAQLANRGMHGGDGAPVKVLELSHLGEKRSRYYLTFLQHGMQNNRPPVLKGVVDLVLGPSSLRVYIPHDNFQIPVKIAGVFTPNAALSAKDKADPFADESKDFAVRLLQQRDVNVQVYTTDRAGNFLCAVFLPDGTNAAVALVGAGLATVGHTDKLPFAQQLVDAEQAAKSNGKYIWSGEGAKPQRAAKVEAERLARNAQDLTPMPNSIFQSFCMTEVSEDGLSVYLQAFGEEVDGEKGKVQALVNRTVAMTEECNPRKGDLIVAQYSSDKTWCRARVLSIAKDRSEFEVQFIDFGNTEVVKAKYTRSVPRGTDFAMVRDVPPFAKHAFFACVKNTVPNDMYVHVACDTIYSYSEGEVLARPVYKDSVGNVYYCITTNEGVPTLGETLLQKGFVLLDPRTSTLDAELFKQHESAQSIARTGHKGLWQYGDVDDDDDE